MALPKENRLHTKKDFDNIFKNGRALRGHFLLIKYITLDTGSPRIGFIVPAKVASKAVTRNRIRRLLANAIQKDTAIFKKNKNIVVLLLKLPEDKKSEKEILSQELITLLSRI